MRSLEQFYRLEKNVKVVAHTKMHTGIVRTLWGRFTQGSCDLEFLPCDEFLFKIGEPRIPVLEEDREYAIFVDEKGCAVV